LLCSDKCTIPGRREFKVAKEREREREREYYLPEKVEQVEITSRNIGIRRV
jgi:hypothetical protein